MKRLSNIIALIFIFFLIIYSIIIVVNQNKRDVLIKKKGTYRIAIIVDKMVSSHATPYLKYRIENQRKTYIEERAVKRNFYDSYSINDTIIVKTYLLDDRLLSFVCQNLKYEKCSGKQPDNGWLKFTKCKK